MAQGGGDELVMSYDAKLRSLAEDRSHLLLDAEGDEAATYALLVALVSAAQNT